MHAPCGPAENWNKILARRGGGLCRNVPWSCSSLPRVTTLNPEFSPRVKVRLLPELSSHKTVCSGEGLGLKMAHLCRFTAAATNTASICRKRTFGACVCPHPMVSVNQTTIRFMPP
jgi:hypothetical protein